jgi:hypothetical protein
VAIREEVVVGGVMRRMGVGGVGGRRLLLQRGGRTVETSIFIMGLFLV